MRACKALLLGCLLLGCTLCLQAQSTLAATPPMGWNTWNKFACNVSEQLIRESADAMVSSGMKDAGYQYIIIDDCWQVSRDADGNIVADPKTFPSGIKALADYVHGRGLKFGIYSDSGAKTCQGRPGGQGHEYQDAARYAAWGVDYLKYDWCYTGPTQDARSTYTIMHEALLATGRPIVYSVCEWGLSKPWLWAPEVSNLWRTYGDIVDKWDTSPEPNASGFVNVVDKQVGLESFAGPGHWNDPDMLQVGNGGMTSEEYRSQFSLWAVLAAPLLAGNDLRNMTAETREILINREVIAVDQDALGRQGRRVRKEGALEVWSRELADGGRAVVLFNRGTQPEKIAVKWTEIGYPAHLKAEVRDLWQHKSMGSFAEGYSATVAPHAIVMITVRP